MCRKVINQAFSRFVARTDERIYEATRTLAEVSFGKLPPVARIWITEVVGGPEEDICTRFPTETW